MSSPHRRPSGGRPGPEPEAPAGQRGDLVLATRGSDLALAQTRLVGETLASAHPGIGWRILTITTRGDRSAGAGPGAPPSPGADTTPIGSDPGRPSVGEQAVAGTGLAALARVSPGVFTSDVAAAVARGDAAAAVHSLKDLPLDDPVAGPAVIVQTDSTTLIPPDCRFRLDSHRNLIIEIGVVA